MGGKKLVWCCIAGIVLGLVVPLVFPVYGPTALSVGMVAGLGLGYLLDVLDEKKTKNTDTAILTEKAREANRLMERARAEVEEKPAADIDEDMPGDLEEPDHELTDEEQAEKLSEAEEMLRKARERIK